MPVFDIKSVFIGAVCSIGGMLVGKIFSDSVRNIDLSVKNIYKQSKGISRLVFVFVSVKIFLLVKPKEASSLLILITAVVSIYYIKLAMQEKKVSKPLLSGEN